MERHPPTLTFERLRHLLQYFPESGNFRWRVGRSGTRRNGVAGHVNKEGYRDVCVDGRLYKAHRLAFLYMTGGWPTREIDHENGDRADNRWMNLREATSWQNKANQSPRMGRLKGATLDKRTGRWRASIQHKGKKIHLGYFDTEVGAHCAYALAAIEAFGDFARTA